jgi:hypothetical protein
VSITEVALEELAASIKDDLSHADKHVAELATWNTIPPTGFELHAAAMLLHHLYGAIEAIVERCVKTFDGAAPGGEDSHVRLLELGSVAVDDVRGVILPRDFVVDELRRFRRRFRKRYDVDLDVAHIHRVIKSAVAGWPAIRGHLATFAAFVEECTKVAQ